MMLNNIGVITKRQGNIPLALDYYQRSLKIEEEIGNKKGIANGLNNIGAIHEAQGDYPKALEHYLNCLQVCEETGDQRQLASVSSNIGGVYEAQGDYSKALEYFKSSLIIFKKLEDKGGIAYNIDNVGRIYYAQGKYHQALDYYQNSLQIFRDVGDKGGEAYMLRIIGRVDLALNRYDDAIIECKRSLNISEELGSIEIQESACSCLYEAYKGMGKSDKALKYFEQFTILNDSLYNEENTKKITQLEMQYEFDKQEAVNQIEQEKKDVIVAQELKQRKLERNGFIGGFAVVLMFAGVFFRQRNRIGKEKKRSDELLLNILPEEVAEELKTTGHSEAQLIDQVTVLFTDFKGFTTLSEQLSPKELVADLHACFSEFDRICEHYGIEKIKTIGDAYMAAGGLPTLSKTHVQDVVRATLEMVEVVERIKAKKAATNQAFFEVRIGVHTGPVVAGIVGVKKFQYDIWGDTVNTASRMESSGNIGKVNISKTTFEILKDNADFTFDSRGKVAAKGKGEMDMWFVSRK